MQDFSAGRALSEAFEIFKARFVPMAILTIGYYVALGLVFGTIGMAMLAPLFASAASGEPADPAALTAGMGGGVFLLYLVIYALNFWQQGAMCRLTSDRHGGSLGDAIAAGLRSVLPLFGVAIIAFVVLMAGGLVVGLIVGFAAAGAESPAIGFIFGLIAIIGFIYLAMRLSMLLPAIAIEEVRNPLTAMSRSWAMTKGHVLKLLLVFLVMTAVMALLGITLVLLTIGMPSPGAVPGTGGLIGLVIAMVVLALTIGIYFMALVGAIHRQLGGESVAEVEATFA